MINKKIYYVFYQVSKPAALEENGKEVHPVISRFIR
jgi:hypothetical protein